jgi:hypothetical protein
MKDENIKPVGKLSVPFTLISDGTHINTAIKKDVFSL